MTVAEMILLSCATVGVMGVLIAWFTTQTRDALFVFYVLLIVAAVLGHVVLR